VDDVCIIALPTITIRARDVDRVAVVEVAGDIDMSNADQVRGLLTASVDRQPAGLVVDLTGIDFFSSAGINALVFSAARARAQAVTMVVVAGQRAVLRPLEITGVDEVLTLHPTVELAMAAVRTEEAHRPPSSASDARAAVTPS
jgi:anti-anti-sigma factor